MSRNFFDLELKYNIKVATRERGKLIHTYESHNIFVDSGRSWLAQLLAYKTLPTPPTQPAEGTSTVPGDTYVNHRIRYVGVGIGGTRQHYPASYFTNPPLDVYSASFTQDDVTPSVAHIETPVPIQRTSGNLYYLAQVTSSQVNLPAHQMKFTKIFTENELSFESFPLIPISEVGLFTNEANPFTNPYPSRYDGPMVAYDTVDTIPKNNAICVQIDWILRV